MNYYIFAKFPGRRKHAALDLMTGDTVGTLAYATAFKSFEAAEDKVKMLRAIHKKADFEVREAA